MNETQHATRDTHPARMVGTVKFWNRAMRYGYIARARHSMPGIYVHYSDVKPLPGRGTETLKVGDTVEFNLEETNTGLRATNVTIIVVASGVTPDVEAGILPDRTSGKARKTT